MTDVFAPLRLIVSEVFSIRDPLCKILNYQRPYSWTHVSFRANKSDYHPQLSLIKLLRDLREEW
ncbi:MAG: hypothetical protein KGQ86_09115 [Bacteroidetes bacterium]|nr:hypothetical protein [Bacteroidota bacterium]